MKTPFGPKSNVIIVRISALLYNRAKILTIITLLFGPNGVFIKSFRFLLTFNSLTLGPTLKYFDCLHNGTICEEAWRPADFGSM